MNLSRLFFYLRRIALVAFIGAAGLGLVVLWAIDRYQPRPLDHVATPAALTEKFEEIVFGRDFRQDVTRVYKWKGPYRIRLRDPFPQSLRMSLERHIKKLREITGLEFSISQAAEKATVAIHILHDEEFQSLAQEFKSAARNKREWLNTITCFMITDGNPLGRNDISSRYTITRGIIGISSNLSRTETESCLLEELYQGLGPGKDSLALLPSITSSLGTQTVLSLNDKIILRVLYDKRITPGTSRTQAVAVARDIIIRLVAAVKQNGEAALTHPRYRPNR